MFSLSDVIGVIQKAPRDSQTIWIDKLRKTGQIRSHILSTSFGRRLVSLTDDELQYDEYVVDALGINRGIPGAPSVYITVRDRLTRLTVIYAAFYIYENDNVNELVGINNETREYTKSLDYESMIAFAALDVDAFLIPFVMRELALRAETISSINTTILAVRKINPRFDATVMLYFSLEHALLTKKETALIRNEIDVFIQTEEELDRHLPVFLPLVAATNVQNVIDWWLTTVSVIWRLDRDLSIVTCVNYLAGDILTKSSTTIVDTIEDHEMLAIHILRQLSPNLREAYQTFLDLSPRVRYPPKSLELLERMVEIES